MPSSYQLKKQREETTMKDIELICLVKLLKLIHTDAIYLSSSHSNTAHSIHKLLCNFTFTSQFYCVHFANGLYQAICDMNCFM